MVVESEASGDVGVFELQSNVDFSISPLVDTEIEYKMANRLTCIHVGCSYICKSRIRPFQCAIYTCLYQN